MKIKRIHYVLFVLSISMLFACANDKSANKTETEKGEKLSEDNSIIRHPINNDGEIDSSQLAIITFEEEEYDFGEISEGEVIEHTFNFKNEGQSRLLISHARSTCGCTVPEWPKEPIDPGKSGSIHVRFDSENRTGKQKKPITIITNAFPSKRVIYLKGNVVANNN